MELGLYAITSCGQVLKESDDERSLVNASYIVG